VYVGEIVTFSTVVTLPEVTTDVTVTLTLPKSGSTLLFDANPSATVSATTGSQLRQGASSTIAATSSTLTDNVIVLSFGTITNIADGSANTGDQLTVVLTFVVADAAPVVDGASLDVASAVRYDSTDLATQTLTLTAKLPVLTLSQTTDASTTHDAGDVISFSLTVSHGGSSHGAAYGLTIVETHDTHLHIDVSSVTCSPSCDNSTLSVSNDFAAKTITFVMTVLNTGTTLSLGWSASVIQSSLPGISIADNSATLAYHTSSLNLSSQLRAFRPFT
jgi:hypothetical protein